MSRSPASTKFVASCLDLLSLRGVMAWRNNSTGVFDPTRKVFRTFQGMRGVSDILGVLPGGRLLAVECKTGAARLTPEQRLFLDAVRERGGVGLAVWDLGELDRELNEVL